MSTSLPDKPSALIRVALDDLEKVEADPAYKVCMAVWHAPNQNSEKERCLVCLAGAVMAKTLNTPWSEESEPDEFDDHTSARLCALDMFRCGMIRDGLITLGFIKDRRDEMPDGVPYHMHIGYYDLDRKVFRENMGKLADILEQANL